MTVSGGEVREIESFKYLGFFVQKNGVFDVAVKHRIRCKWIKWKEVSDVLCDKGISIRLKGKFYISIVSIFCMVEKVVWWIRK